MFHEQLLVVLRQEFDISFWFLVFFDIQALSYLNKNGFELLVGLKKT